MGMFSPVAMVRESILIPACPCHSFGFAVCQSLCWNLHGLYPFLLRAEEDVFLRS